MVAQVSIQEGIAITQMSWSCEKFKMDDTDEEQSNNNEIPSEEKTYSLAVSFTDGNIYIMRNYDDIFPIIIRTGLLQTKIEWSNNGEILAIAGHQIQDSITDSNGDRIFTYKNIASVLHIYRYFTSEDRSRVHSIPDYSHNLGSFR